MRIGPFIGTMGAADTLQGQVQQVADAESDGFDSFWTAQVFGVDALTMLALSGEKTRTIEVGTAVVPTYPRHPTALAQQALTTQAATGGRLLLGIGLSHKPIVEGRWGMSFRSPARHMEEYLTILQSLMDTGSVDFRGDHFTVSGDINRLTDSPPTVCIAALGRRMLHLAGSRSGGTITWMVGPRTLDSHIVPRINAAADEAGRPPPRVCVGLPVCVSDDRQTAFEAASGYFHGYGNMPSYRRMLDIEGGGESGGGRDHRERGRGGVASPRPLQRGRDRPSGVRIPGRRRRRRVDREDVRAPEEPGGTGVTL